jgi:hypothetical protein
MLRQSPRCSQPASPSSLKCPCTRYTADKTRGSLSLLCLIDVLIPSLVHRQWKAVTGHCYAVAIIQLQLLASQSESKDGKAQKLTKCSFRSTQLGSPKAQGSQSIDTTIGHVVGQISKTVVFSRFHGQGRPQTFASSSDSNWSSSSSDVSSAATETAPGPARVSLHAPS